MYSFNVFKKLNKFSFLGLVLAIILQLSPLSVDAHKSPIGCSSVGVGLAITAYESDGITPITDPVQSGQTIIYQAELSHLGGTKCDFEGGTLTITSPDGIVHNVTPLGGIPLITFGNPVSSLILNYVVNESNVSASNLLASVNYTSGIVHFAINHQSVSASANISTPYEDLALQVSKTAIPSFVQEFPWTIEKTVSPGNWSLFAGDSGTSKYTVNVTKGSPVSSDESVSGQITIHNPADFADAIISSVTDSISGLGSITVNCAVSFPYTLLPGADLVCTYSSSLPDSSSRTNTATVTTTGDIDGGSGQASIDFSAINPSTVNDSITVNDTNGQSWDFSENGSVNYDKTFDCEEVNYVDGHDLDTYQNTATIVETGDSDDASVDVHCYELSVNKTANTEFSRQYNWNIVKTSDQSTLTLDAGATVDLAYDVTVDLSGTTDKDWSVSGNIQINNPNPDRAASLSSVLDSVSIDPAAVNCPSLSVAANSSLVCTYGPLSLTSADNLINTATVEQSNFDFISDGSSVDGGTTIYTGTANVVFGEPTNVIDESVVVTDSLKGNLGTVNSTDSLPAIFHYTYTVGPFDSASCGDHNINNIASFVTNDSASAGQDDWSVLVTVPCVEVTCTLTQGYWANHSDQGPAPYDSRWANLGDADLDTVNEEESETFFLSAQTYLEVIKSAVKGNVYYQLAQQYIAAKLNVLAGTSAPSDVLTAISQAEALFSTKTPNDAKALKGSAKSQWTNLATILANYNEGITGPGHCE